LTVNDVISYLSSYLTLCDRLNIRCGHPEREDTEDYSEEASQNISIRIRLVIFRVVNLVCHKVAANIEGIAIVAEHHKEEASDSKRCFKVSLHSC
jgi:hypothetical protein